MTSDDVRPIRRRVEQAIEQAVAEGAFDNLAGAGLPLKSETGIVPNELRVPFKVLENAGMAPAWVELAAEIERRIDEFRAARHDHDRRMRRACAHALAGTAGDFAARFRAAGHAHQELRDALAKDVRGIVRLIDRFNTMAPASAPRFGFLARAELEAVDAIWPWPAPGGDRA
ncbi:MAG: DUF1992 domain-containing protein [Chloroflexi bacterium]|nr:DUF1992 domain-containing protein [Chloroflexota bacterium]